MDPLMILVWCGICVCVAISAVVIVGMVLIIRLLIDSGIDTDD